MEVRNNMILTLENSKQVFSSSKQKPLFCLFYIDIPSCEQAKKALTTAISAKNKFASLALCNMQDSFIQDLALQFGVKSAPALVVIDKGYPVTTLKGSQVVEQLQKVLDQFKPSQCEKSEKKQVFSMTNANLSSQIESILAQVKDFQDNAAQGGNREPRVAVFGLLKAGKSSLLNVLTGHYSPDDEVFVTGAVRATVENKSLSYQGISYRDTPGLDANVGDTKEAKSGIRDVDIVLFVHNAHSELDYAERNYLQELAQQMGDRINVDLLVVLSQIDQTPEYEQVKEVVESQLNAIGITPEIFCVSSTIFAKGSLENKQLLVKASGIKALQDKLGSIKEGFAERQMQKQKEVSQRLLEQIVTLQKSCDTQVNKIRNTLMAPFKTFGEYYTGYAKTKDEITSKIQHLKDERARLKNY